MTTHASLCLRLLLRRWGAGSTVPNLPRRALATSAGVVSTSTSTNTCANGARVRAAKAPASNASPLVVRRRPAHSASANANAGTAVHQVKVPRMADSITEGVLKSFSKAVGEYVNADEELASIETDKVDIPVNAPVAGYIRAFHAAPEDKVIVGALLCDIEPSSAAPPPTPPSPAAAATDPTKASKPDQSKQAAQATAPSPQQTADKLQQPRTHAAAPAAATAAAAAAAPARAAESVAERREKLTPMRLKIAERLKLAQNTAASLTTFNEVDMSALIAFRASNKDRVLDEHGIKLGFMSAFVKAVCHAWRHVPAVMSRLEGDYLVHPSSVDVSVAVATKKGLVTPVVRRADKMSFLEIEAELARLAAVARDGKLTLPDLAGGAFTISNGGVFGSLLGTPIINPPQSAVLGMHAVKSRPVVLSDGATIAARPMMYVCLTYDHRVIDGREAATFLVRVKDAIEDPARMLL